MRELRPGLWHWQAPHPEWTPEQWWPQLVDFGRGFQIPPDVLQHGVTREQVSAELRPLLDLPVELVLPAHGAPTDRTALERALA